MCITSVWTVHKESIAVSIARQGSIVVRRYGIIGGTLDAVDKLVKKLASPRLELRFVYEAGPCGFVICRHLRSKGIHCDGVSPSLIPKKASDRVKTDRRDADQLARLYRAGELTPMPGFAFPLPCGFYRGSLGPWFPTRPKPCGSCGTTRCYDCLRPSRLVRVTLPTGTLG